jgi:hypothetical protein
LKVVFFVPIGAGLNAKMKKAIFTLAAATLMLVSASFAQSPPAGGEIFAVTNDDNPTLNSNTATVFGFPTNTLNSSCSTAPCLFISQTLHTNGTGLAGSGALALTRVATASTDKCLFVADAGASTGYPTGDIAGFEGTPGTYGTSTRFASQDTGVSHYGIGLAVNPRGTFLFASLDYSNSIETFKLNPGTGICMGTPVANILAAADPVGPLAVSSDGKVLVVSGVGASEVTAYRIHAGGNLTLINTVNLAGVSSCTVPGCYPTGIDISEVSALHTATVTMGNAITTAPDYITCDLNTVAAIALTGCTNQPITGPGTAVTNIENPFYNKAGYSGVGADPGIYFGGSGLLGPCGVSLNPVGVGGAVTALSTGFYQQPAATPYCSNAQDDTNGATQYVWQSGATSGAVNTMYLYKSNGVTISPEPPHWPKSLANPNANGTSLVLSLQALNEAGAQTR